MEPILFAIQLCAGLLI